MSCLKSYLILLKYTVESNVDEYEYYYAEMIMSKLYAIIFGVRNVISISSNTTVNDFQLYGKA